MISSRSANILLADDSLFYREKLCEVLTDAGHRVHFAFDGAGVIDELRRDPTGIDLLLLDLQMPHVDGFRVLDWINENDLRGAFPVLCVTGEYDTSLLSRRVVDELGAKALLTKDITPGEAVFYVNRFIYGGKKEARKEARVSVDAPASFTLGSHAHDGTVMNISTGGVYMHTPVPLARGNRFSMTFKLSQADGDAKTLLTNCEVKWTTPAAKRGPGPGGAGLSFRTLSRREKKAIGTYLAARSGAKKGG